MNKEVFFKCLLTGIIYAIVTCIIQVPIANVLFSLLRLQPETSISSDRVPLLLLSILVVGVAMAIFFYRNGHLFLPNSKLKQGFKFALFIYLSNYIPQVFFLDANKGFSVLITGGFPVIQVELFDLIILVITVLAMITYMPCCYEFKYEKERNTTIWWKSFLCGIVFAIILIVLQEFLLPQLGMQSMATGLNVLNKNKLFFYSVMFVGFVLAGSLVSYYAFTLKSKNYFCLEYGVLIWSAFDLTMIPLGFGIIPTLAFMATSTIAFAVMECMVLMMWYYNVSVKF